MLQTTLTPVQRVFLTLIRLAVPHIIYLFIILFVECVSFLYLRDCSTDVLESVSLLSGVFTPLNFPQSRRYRVSLLLNITSGF